MLTRLLTSVSAITLAGVSMANNIDFASSYGTRLIALAIAFDTIKITAPSLMAQATRNRQPIKWASVAALWAIGGTLSALAAIGAISEMRQDKQAMQQHVNQTRATTLILQDLNRIQAIRGLECQAPKTSRKYGKKSKRYCPQIATLKTELAISKKADKTGKTRTKENNIQAKTIATLLNDLVPQLKLTSEKVSYYISLALVLAIELGALLAGFAFIGKNKTAKTELTPKQLNQLIQAANQT